MSEYKVKDTGLSKEGKLKLDWAEAHMPVLMKIRKDLEKRKPFKNLIIGACLHVTKETGVLVRTLKAGGAEIFLCASNPLSTQDDVAAALVDDGIHVFAWKGMKTREYYWAIEQVLNGKPQLLLDDGADLISTVHLKRKELIPQIIAGQEETTTGVIRFRAMEKDGALKFPVIAVNDTPTKRMFDNVYGTGQSTIDGILRSTNIMIAGKNFVVCGYGYCGKGVARRAHGMGANIIVVEADPVKALQAVMDGFRVMPIKEAAKIGDIFVTVTGDINVIRKEHIERMKDGAILANSGHFNVEIDIKGLKELSIKSRKIRNNVEEFILKTGKRVYLLSEGRLVNLAAAEGHPSEVMDMSFSNHALVAEWVLKNHKKLEPKVYDVPDEIDKKIAKLKLETLDISIDELTDEQKEYLSSWEKGT